MNTTEETRWIQRLFNFSRALAQLEAAVELANQRPLSALEQQGMIQSFGCTHELSWNVLRDFLRERGAAQVYGSKDAVREGFKSGLASDADVWMEMIRDRNQSSHTYNLQIAEAIADRITRTYVHAFVDLRQTFGKRVHVE